MKQRKYAGILFALLMSLTLLSCAAKQTKKPELTVESYTELNTVLKLPPVNVPGGAWTEADIQCALYLGAKPFSFPGTFNAMGSKFSVDQKAADFTYTKDNELTATLLYDGCACGTVCLTDCPSQEDYFSGFVSSVTFKDLGRSDLPAPAIFPVAFNGITIGSTAEQVKNNLGTELTVSGAEIRTPHHIIQLKGSPAEGVTAITLTYVR